VDCDFPYIITGNGRRIVSISYATPGLIDYDIMLRGPVQALADMKYTFDAAYQESKRHPMKFCYAAHTHWGGLQTSGTQPPKINRFSRIFTLDG
jgi:hypothetical protein